MGIVPFLDEYVEAGVTLSTGLRL